MELLIVLIKGIVLVSVIVIGIIAISSWFNMEESERNRIIVIFKRILARRQFELFCGVLAASAAFLVNTWWTWSVFALAVIYLGYSISIVIKNFNKNG